MQRQPHRCHTRFGLACQASGLAPGPSAWWDTPGPRRPGAAPVGGLARNGHGTGIAAACQRPGPLARRSVHAVRANGRSSQASDDNNQTPANCCQPPNPRPILRASVLSHPPRTGQAGRWLTDRPPRSTRAQPSRTHHARPVGIRPVDGAKVSPAVDVAVPVRDLQQGSPLGRCLLHF